VLEILVEVDIEGVVVCEGVELAEPDSEACGEDEADTLLEPDGEACGDCETVTIGEEEAEPSGDCETVTIGEADAETCDEDDADTLLEPEGEACDDDEADTLLEPEGEACGETLTEKDDTPDVEIVTDCVTETFADLEPVDETDELLETKLEPDDNPVFEFKAEVVDVWVDVTLPRGDLEVVPESLKLRVPAIDFVSVGLAVWLRVGRLLLDTELEIETIPEAVPLNEEYSETVKYVLTVADEDALIDGLPLDDQEATSDDDVLGLADPEPDNEDELEIVFWDVHDGE